MSGRTAFVVDGFNVYHSLVEASRSLGLPAETGTKWLNYRSLCESYLPVFGRDAILTGVHYYSALAHHIDAGKPGVVARHQYYTKVLEATGVTVELGRFKKKKITCRHCSKSFVKHEEKETDVAVAVKVLEIFACDQADRVVIMTGDTDVAPVVRAVQRVYPLRHVCFAFPWNRKRAELAALTKPKPCISITREAYRAHQFADPVVIGGTTFKRPPSW